MTAPRAIPSERVTLAYLSLAVETIAAGCCSRPGWCWWRVRPGWLRAMAPRGCWRPPRPPTGPRRHAQAGRPPVSQGARARTCSRRPERCGRPSACASARKGSTPPLHRAPPRRRPRCPIVAAPSGTSCRGSWGTSSSPSRPASGCARPSCLAVVPGTATGPCWPPAWPSGWWPSTWSSWRPWGTGWAAIAASAALKSVKRTSDASGGQSDRHLRNTCRPPPNIAPPPRGPLLRRAVAALLAVACSAAVLVGPAAEVASAAPAPATAEAQFGEMINSAPARQRQGPARHQHRCGHDQPDLERHHAEPGRHVARPQPRRQRRPGRP